MRRVLLVFEPPDGGVATNVSHLAQGLREHGWEPELAGPLDALPYHTIRDIGVPVHRLPLVRGYGSPGKDLAALRGLARLLSNRRYDLVHLHSAKAGVIGRMVAIGMGVPWIYSPHCFPFVGDFGKARRWFALSTEVVLGRTPGGAILCVCDDERSLALRHRVTSAERLLTVHNGTHACRDEATADPEILAFADGGPVAAAVAVLRPQKSLETLLDATPSILERSPQARVAIIGDGPQREELLQRAADLGLLDSPRFRFFPFAPPADAYLKAIDVYVLPSSWEAFPIGILEALACGVPQVATDVGGTREAVGGDTGLLVPPKDPQALADAVTLLLEDPARRVEMARASQSTHAASFTVERMVAQTASAYARVAMPKSNPPPLESVPSLEDA